MPTTSTDRRLLVGVLVAAGALVLLPVVFAMLGATGTGAWGMGPGHTGPWGGTGGAAAGWFVLVALLSRLLLFAVVLGGAVLLYRAITDRGAAQGGAAEGDDAMEELRLAYARGDLTDEEYERRRDRLQEDR